MNNVEELHSIANKLSGVAKALDDSDFVKPLDELDRVAKEFGKAWSGSWLGYHSNVYYVDFFPPPLGAQFSREWGLKDTFSEYGTNGEWREYKAEDVLALIGNTAGCPDTKTHQDSAKKAAEIFDDAKWQVISIVSHAIDNRPNDKLLVDLHAQVQGLKIFNAVDVVSTLMPKGKFSTRDMAAFERGPTTPPHVSVQAKVAALRFPFHKCKELSKIATRISAHLMNHASQSESATHNLRVGTKVFIGHGRSTVWRDLKDFIQDRLHLTWDEFNRLPAAGITTAARLSQMLDESAVALLIMTAEDEQSDGKHHARMNVVHEAGLFQGRLGFKKAIVLLESGCEEFSNIHGLGQIRFPKGNIRAVFEDVRQLLEREGILK
jgi:predicted nucleotide-binding protein